MEAVVARDLAKRFGDLVAVDHVSFAVKEGEVFGLLGPNGAGKTTTISMLITLRRPDEGEAWVAGHSVTREPTKVRENIGVVFQDPSVDRELTGWENLWIHGVIYGVPRIELRSRIRSLLEFVELWDRRNTPVKHYSGGMVRRLEIARALIHDPEILFLDEPTLGLDPQTRAKIWDYLEEIRRSRNTTVFLTTHYMDEAERLCDRVAIMDHGRIVAIDTPEGLIARLGGDVVYVKLDSRGEELGRLLVEEGVASSYRLAGDTVMLSVGDASSSLPRVFDAASRLGVRIIEASYRRPSLGDVFLHYTGRSLRDSEADWRETARLVARRKR